MGIGLTISHAARKTARRLGVEEPALKLRDILQAPEYPGLQLTLKRRLNAYLVRYQHARGDLRLRGYPLVLTIEATNVCNLRCPGCFTGIGEVGRGKSMLEMELYRKLLGELGDRLLRVEFYNWGEPLLNKHIYDMMGDASTRGISTTISTNFSLPFDAEKAEHLVRSGLATLGVSLDGASQETYAQYRIRGDFDTVIKNVKLVNDAKRKLGSALPELIWEYHVFAHNRHEIDRARAMAAELSMSIAVSKGWIAGDDWDPEGAYEPQREGVPERCSFLWQRAIVNNDGGVAPCCGTFYREDDFGQVRTEPSVPLSALVGATFREAWNNENFRTARAMFRQRGGAGKQLICYDCPATVGWLKYREHLQQGRTAETFSTGFRFNDGFNYFFDRRKLFSSKLDPSPGSPSPDDAIPLVQPAR